MFCTSCGKEIDDGSIFCTHCGGKQNQGEPTSYDTSKIEPIDPVPEEAQSSEGNGVDGSKPFIGVIPLVPLEVPVPPIVAIPTVKPIEAPVSASGFKPDNRTHTNPVSAQVNEEKKPKSSIVVFGIIAVAVIVALILLFGKGSGYTDYKDLVKDYYNAIYKQDFNALLKCYDKEDQKDIKDDKKDYVDDLKDIKEDYDDKYDKGWNKKINIKSRVKTDSDDGTITYAVVIDIDKNGPEYLSIKKYKNKYTIDSSGDAF